MWKSRFWNHPEMARLTKAGSSQGQKTISDSVNKPPSKTLIIPATELVQIIAKGVPVTRDGLASELQQEKQQDILTDSTISQSRHVEVERELGRWVPDEDVPECPELDNIFNGPWNRDWDQFEANETLFGVKSTFNEDLYTTKLDRGPQTRELEREALRIAREIEVEDTQDLHLAEERGIQLPHHIELDEETRFSSVFRGVDDSGYDEKENLLDSRNIETFGGVSDSFIGKSFTSFKSGKSNDGAEMPSSSSSMDDIQSSQSMRHWSASHDHTSLLALDGASRVQEGEVNENLGGSRFKELEKKVLHEKTQPSKPREAHPPFGLKKDSERTPSKSATSYAPPISEGQEKNTPNTLGRNIAVSASPSSSSGSLSTLNPHAKEFKLNPNAKSFTPNQTTVRPASPLSNGSYYYQANVTAVPNMHGIPVAIGVGQSFGGHQQVMFNPQAASVQAPQSYFHPNGPQYGQHMILGQPRQVVYMPTYPQEMQQYKGREF
ncbi:LsmAD domain-containing protein [Heracleum sosnowskyi]|uniref:LsmAD domain-containing protein n=1 Tax=Heracleum sosnowskyi TaxID=360622 RepID=A0AAD8HZZ3_9APIA|nr:LsmAD domain-containing protein [Heracleum sosnowskyi]